MNSLNLIAARTAEKLRISMGVSMFDPINIFDICEDLEVTVRFVNTNMEGMYVASRNNSTPVILVSNQRPMVRRTFTAAHELGHHIFKHGSNIDNLGYSNKYSNDQNQEEALVNSFAGTLLMPAAGIMAEISTRNWTLEKMTCKQFYLLSNYFGVGYQTLIYHCRSNNLISYPKTINLLKTSPAKIIEMAFDGLLGKTTIKIFDHYSVPDTIDLEVSHHILLPKTIEIEHEFLPLVHSTKKANIYQAMSPGIVAFSSFSHQKDIAIRIEKKLFQGLSIYRHLQNI